MVTIEKFQGPCAHSKGVSPACDQERLIVDECRRVKEINPNVSTIFYYNSVLDFPQYRLHTTMRRHRLRDAKGQVVKMHCPSPKGSCDVFDFSQLEARELFIAECVNVTQSGVVDGCFLDRAVDGTPTDPTLHPAHPGNKYGLTWAKAVAYTEGHVQVLTELQHRLGDGPVIANHAYGPPLSNLGPGAVGFSMIESFGPNNNSIHELQVAAANDRGVQAHAGARCEAVTVDHIAAFLIGAGHRALFGCGPWSSAWQPGALDIAKAWLPEYDKPLGLPKGKAEYKAGLWRREFEHVKVTFNPATGKGAVQGW